MSKLRTHQGDDHPEAMIKHLLDEQVLLGKKTDHRIFCLLYIADDQTWSALADVAGTSR